MNNIQQRHKHVTEAVLDLAPDVVAYVPSNSIAGIINGLAESGVETHPVSREEEAVGIIGALPLTGKFGVIVMQDNGFGNALTALTTFVLAYHLPLLIVANTRGGLGEYNSMIHAISAPVPKMLDAAGIPVFDLDRRNPPEDWRATIAVAGNHARMTFRPVAVLMEFFDYNDKESRA